MTSAHLDTFVRDRLPAASLQPRYLFDLPQLQFPDRLNCASRLLDRHVASGTVPGVVASLGTAELEIVAAGAMS